MMGDKTGISWTDTTWNPLVGCSRVSEGCRNCYAEQLAGTRMRHLPRYEGLTRPTAGGPRWTGEVRLDAGVLALPLRWTRPRRVFVNSMSDLFHEAVPFKDIAAIFGVMAVARSHTFQVLTKRPQRALDFFAWVQAKAELTAPTFPRDPVAWRIVRVVMGHAFDRGAAVGVIGSAQWPLPNVHLGVSVEDQATADTRIPLLLEAPAAVRWLSIEPQLDAITLWDHLSSIDAYGEASGPAHVMLDWIVIGGESGPGARPFDLAWARQLLDEAHEAGVAPFVKQLGARPVEAGSALHLKHRAGADPSEWPEDLRVQEWPSR